MKIDPERYELSALLERLPIVDGCRVVEIGCGDGRLTERYSDRVGSVLAIDPDAGAITTFRENGPASNVTLRVASMEGINLPDASVDVVLFSWAL